MIFTPSGSKWRPLHRWLSVFRAALPESAVFDETLTKNRKILRKNREILQKTIWKSIFVKILLCDAWTYMSRYTEELKICRLINFHACATLDAPKSSVRRKIYSTHTTSGQTGSQKPWLNAKVIFLALPRFFEPEIRNPCGNSLRADLFSAQYEPARFLFAIFLFQSNFFSRFGAPFVCYHHGFSLLKSWV